MFGSLQELSLDICKHMHFCLLVGSCYAGAVLQVLGSVSQLEITSGIENQTVLHHIYIHIYCYMYIKLSGIICSLHCFFRRSPDRGEGNLRMQSASVAVVWVAASVVLADVSRRLCLQ